MPAARKMEPRTAMGMLRPGVRASPGEIDRALKAVEAEHDARRRHGRQDRSKIRPAIARHVRAEVAGGRSPLAIRVRPVAAGTTSLNRVMVVLERGKEFHAPEVDQEVHDDEHRGRLPGPAGKARRGRQPGRTDSVPRSSARTPCTARMPRPPPGSPRPPRSSSSRAATKPSSEPCE